MLMALDRSDGIGSCGAQIGSVPMVPMAPGRMTAAQSPIPTKDATTGPDLMGEHGV